MIEQVYHKFWLELLCRPWIEPFNGIVDEHAVSKSQLKSGVSCSKSPHIIVSLSTALGGVIAML